jgi:hypothetical protein
MEMCVPAAIIGESCLSPNELVEQARLRLSEELERWPPVESPLLWAVLRTHPSPLPSAGAQVHYIRVARIESKHRLARELFVWLLEQIESTCAAWAVRCVARTPAIPAGERDLLREDLRQELALHLWDQIGLRTTPGWELFFQQSLIFAEQHIATSLMQQRGYWLRTGVARPQRASQRLLIHLEAGETADWQQLLPPDDGVNHFSGAELADLRSLVQRLPAHPRMAIELRYWHDASEEEIARALGGVTTRTVRNYLRQGYTLLRGWYGESEIRA